MIRSQYGFKTPPPSGGMSTYAMAASKKPSTFFEIGSADSTKFFAKAIRDQALNTQIISVDPQPREDIDKLCTKIYWLPLEYLTLVEFTTIGPGDILIFDRNHRRL